MASCAPKRARVEEEDNTVQGYLHCVSKVKISLKNKKYFNCLVQTSRDEYRRAVIFGAEKHGRFEQAAAEHTAVKLGNVRRSLSHVGADYDVLFNHVSTIEVVVSLGFGYKEPSDCSTFTIVQVAGLRPHQKVGKIKGKVVWLQACSNTANVFSANLEVRECHLADETGKIKVVLWEGLIGQVAEGVSYVLTDLSVRDQGGLSLTTTKTTTIRVSEEAVLVPQSVERQQMEMEQEVLTTVRGPVSGVQLTDQRQCSSCQKRQLAFNVKAKNHRCEACGLLQRVGAYTQAVNGTVMVNEGEAKLKLTLTMTVLMTYLTLNDLQELLADVELVEEHFLDVGVFEITYNANNVVGMLSRVDEGGEPVEMLGLEELFE